MINKIELIKEDKLIEVLEMRTGMKRDDLSTILYSLERAIIHYARKGNNVRLGDLFTIYWDYTTPEIRLNEIALGISRGLFLRKEL